MKHLINLFALISLLITAQAQENLIVSDTLQHLYNMVVETDTIILDCFDSSTGALDEALVHRFYLEAADATDKLYQVFGNNDHPMVITAPSGVWNFSVLSSWNASNVNPGLFPVFPCLEFDSYATIKLDQSASAPGELNASLVEDNTLSPTVSQFFTQNSAGENVELNVNTLTGAAWYVSASTPLESSNNLPDEDGRWLVMQLTSASHVEGVLNFMISPFGDSPATIINRPFNTVPFCTDPSACNYEPSAFNDQGICDYSCCPGPGCCGEGTTWDSESQTCLTTYLHDADFDGCVGMTDLLDLLSVFGTCLEE